MDATPPSDRARIARIALAVLGGALGTALVAGALYLAFKSEPAPPRQTEIEEAERTEPATLPPSVSEQTTSATGSGVTTAAPGSPSDGEPGGTGGSPKARAARSRIAYRLAGQVHVAAEDGSAVVALGVDYDAYQLSSDGRYLAGMNAVPGGGPAVNIAVHDLTLGGMRLAGSSVRPIDPSWAPRGDWIAYTSEGTAGGAIHRVSRNGSDDRQLAAAGVQPVVSRSGRRIAFRLSDDAASPLRVLDVTTAAARTVGGASGALSYAWAADDVLYFTRASDSPKRWEVRRARAPYSSSERVASMPLPASAFALSSMSLSPDGKRGLLAAIGDDDFSRLYVLDIAGGDLRLIETRRDAYPAGWTAKGARILYFEGNAYQGETSSLLSSLPDGSRRRVVAQGATR